MPALGGRDSLASSVANKSRHGVTRRGVANPALKYPADLDRRAAMTGRVRDEQAEGHQWIAFPRTVAGPIITTFDPFTPKTLARRVNLCSYVLPPRR